MFSRFLHVESCGQCGACKINSGEIAKTLERLENGGADERDINNVASQLRMVTDQSRCYLPEELQVLVRSILTAFPEDFVDHLERQLKPRRTYQLPKIVDLQGGQATYDERINYKQPDWTYLNPPLAG
jgi:hypothetical protein